MSAPVEDLRAVRRVADAVLYEGYLLYPYRASSSKNQVRWQFGVLGPRGAAEAGVGEAASLHTECLVDLTAGTTVDIYLRFLHSQWRAVERAEPDGTFTPVEQLSAGPARWISWHEAVEQECMVSGLRLADVQLAAAGGGRTVDIQVPGGEELELLRDDSGRLLGRLVRTRWPLAARLEVSAAPVAGCQRARVLRIEVTNTAEWQPGRLPSTGASHRDLAARRSLIGTHLILVAHAGSFVSAVDPPEWAAAAARGCGNSRCWPVLAGVHDPVDAQSSAVLLAAPIILYDHPAVADESPGDLFDATEIDEILTLRIMTLTEDEKRAARGTDPRAAAILNRCDDMPPEIFERLHGAVRSAGLLPAAGETGLPEHDPGLPALIEPDLTNFSPAGAPWWDPAEDAGVSPETDAVLIGSTRVTKGSRVLLRPSRRADAQDLFLTGMTATVHAVLADVDGGSHVAVSLDDDPASDLHEWYGRYYYFAPEELEPLPVAAP